MFVESRLRAGIVRNLYYTMMVDKSIAPAGFRAPERNPHTEPLGLYIHIPFCAQKCPYCDFNTYAGLDGLHDAYVDALCAEIHRWSVPLAGRTVTTIFLGGGTPTVLAIPQLERILSVVRDAFALAPDCELTSEANPGTVDRATFAGLAALGINRLSMGTQSFDAGELAFLGRIHGVDEVYAAFDAARAAGLGNINLDLMFGLPGQDPAAWEASLDRALALGPEHLSLYSLIVEPGTPLYTWVQTGQVAAPDDDAAAELYERARGRLGAAGYAHYEVSNWARELRGTGAAGPDEPGAPGPDVPSISGADVPAARNLSPAHGALVPALACRHNLIYWRNQDYLGVGPGAHSHLRGAIGVAGAGNGQGGGAPADVPMASGMADRRWGNIRPVPGYIRRIAAGEPVEAFHEDLDPRTAMGETMMLGLRLVGEGVAFDHFRALHGRDLREVFAEELAELAGWGLVTADAARVRLTERGLMVGNRVFERFVGG